MPPTQINTQVEATEVLTRPYVPTPQEFYCLVMRPIEPDLLFSTEEREQKYAGETSAEKKKRMQRYEQAFANYKVQKQAVYSGLQASVSFYVRSLRASAESASIKDDERLLHDIEVQVSLLAA